MHVNPTEPAHHRDHDLPCAACGARWEPVPAPGQGHHMPHKANCAYIKALQEHDQKQEGRDAGPE